MCLVHVPKKADAELIKNGQLLVKRKVLAQYSLLQVFQNFHLGPKRNLTAKKVSMVPMERVIINNLYLFKFFE